MLIIGKLTTKGCQMRPTIWIAIFGDTIEIVGIFLLNWFAKREERRPSMKTLPYGKNLMTQWETK